VYKAATAEVASGGAMGERLGFDSPIITAQRPAPRTRHRAPRTRHNHVQSSSPGEGGYGDFTQDRAVRSSNLEGSRFVKRLVCATQRFRPSSPERDPVRVAREPI
jgi:hypothetical protein